MPALGLVLMWGGYWFLAYGLALRKGAQVGLIDMALPSRRESTLAAIRGAYANPSGPSTGGGSSKKSGSGGGVIQIPQLPKIGPPIPIPGTPWKIQP